MKTRIKLAWVLFLLVSSGITQAEPKMAPVSAFTARSLLAACNSFLTDSTLPYSRMCYGYMTGWAGGIDGALVPNDKGILATATFEEGVDVPQMIKVFVLYVQNHPEEENKPARDTLMHALLNAELVTLESPGKDKGK